MPRLNTICGRDETLASPSDGLHERVLKIFRAGGAAARRGRGLPAVGMRWAEGSDERAGDPEPGRQYEAIQVGPGARKRAMMPTMKPITMIQIMFDTMIFPWPLADRRGVSPIHRSDFPPCFNVDAHHRVPTRFKGRAPVALRFPVEPPGDLLLDSARRFA
jgi:hypothetical protein